MKSYFAALLLALTATLLTNTDTQAAPRKLKGSGQLITKELTLPEFSAVTAARAINVVLVADMGQPAHIEADDNVMEWVVTKVESGVLKVTIDKEVRSLSSIHVTVKVPTNGRLHALRASSAAEIRGEVKITGTEVDLSASSAAKIFAKVEAEKVEADLSSAADIKAEVTGGNCSIEATSSANFKGTLAVRHCEVEASSAADVYLEGAAHSCEAELSSAADLNAKKFAVQEYEIEVSSAADANILCLESLHAKASSAGDITYMGNCTKTHLSRSSGGSIKRR